MRRTNYTINMNVRKILYFPLYICLKLHALMPLNVLYILADILFFPLYYIIRYRRKLIRENLSASFPEKSKSEIVSLEKKFYRHFCDYIVETIKLMHISDEEMKRRMVFTNAEMVQEFLDNGQSCIMLLGHYGNWEWIPSVSLWLPKHKYILSQIYRPLKNKWFDDFFLQLRSRFGTISIAKQDTLRTILSFRASGKPSITGFIADQTPSPANIHFRTTFLGRKDTAILTGAEKIARKTGFVVVYLDVECPKRGYYTATYKLISDTPQNTKEFEITTKYAKEMEKTILRAPQYWLWTHNRWKHNLPES